MPKWADAISQDLAIIPAHVSVMSSAEKRDLFHKSKPELEKRELRVFSYFDYDQKYLKGSKQTTHLACPTDSTSFPSTGKLKTMAASAKLETTMEAEEHYATVLRLTMILGRTTRDKIIPSPPVAE